MLFCEEFTDCYYPTEQRIFLTFACIFGTEIFVTLEMGQLLLENDSRAGLLLDICIVAKFSILEKFLLISVDIDVPI